MVEKLLVLSVFEHFGCETNGLCAILVEKLLVSALAKVAKLQLHRETTGFSLCRHKRRETTGCSSYA